VLEAKSLQTANAASAHGAETDDEELHAERHNYWHHRASYEYPREQRGTELFQAHWCPSCSRIMKSAKRKSISVSISIVVGGVIGIGMQFCRLETRPSRAPAPSRYRVRHSKIALFSAKTGVKSGRHCHRGTIGMIGSRRPSPRSTQPKVG